MKRLEIRLLGPFEVTLDGELVDGFESAKVRALLAVLAAEPQRPQRRDQLAGLLWPDWPQKSAMSNLRYALSDLRKNIGDREAEPPFLAITRQTIQLNPEGECWVDVGAFIKEGRPPTADRPDAAVSRLRLAVDLYRGDFLEGFSLSDSLAFEDWMRAKGEYLRRDVLDALDTLTAVELQRGAFTQAQVYARQQIAIDRLDERAYRRLFEALARNGQRNEALVEYAKLLELLAAELGVEPSEETQQLHVSVLRGEYRPNAVMEEAKQIVVFDDFQSGDVQVRPPAFLEGENSEKGKRGVFVGRERELTRLHEFLDKALTDQGCLAFTVGEAGKGKTSLLNEFANRAQASQQDLIVASGVCDAYSGAGNAYQPFRDVMAMLTGDVETHWSAGDITRDHALRLWRLLPVMTSIIVEQAPNLFGTFVSPEALTRRIATFASSEWSKLSPLQERLAKLIHISRQSEDQNQLFGTYIDVLKVLAKQHPLVLILDDLHWADISSINLLFQLARRVGESRILIVGAYRPEEIILGRDGKEHPLKGVLNEYKRIFGDIWIDMDQGEQAESRAFVDDLLDSEPNRLGERFRQELTHHTQGHPLFTVELLQDMQERGNLVQDETGYWIESPDLEWDTFPAKVEGVIAKRISRLDADLKEALTVASVQGETFTAEVIARVLGVEEQALVRRLSGELDKQHRLVWAREIEHSGGQRLSHYQFRHNLFQRYLYTNLDGVERAYQHEAVGIELEDLYAHRLEELEGVAGQLARHFHEAGDKVRALKYTIQAGDKAVHLYAYEEAQQFLRRALKLSEEDEMLFEVRMELLEKLGDVFDLLHKDTQSISYYQSALELLSSREGAGKMVAVRLHRKILETALNLRWNIEIEALDPWSQTLAASQAYLETRMPLAQNEPQLEWVRVLTTLAKAYENGFPSPMDVDRAEGYAKAAVDLAEQLDAPEELSPALGVLGNIYYDRGRFRDHLAVSHRRLDLSRDQRFGDQGKQMPILLDHSSALMAVGEYALAMKHILEGERLAIQIRSIGGQVWSLGLQAQCMLRLDRWDEILKIEAKHRELERRYSLNQLGGSNCVVDSICAATHALQGNLDKARVLREKSYVHMTRDSGGSPENWGRTQYY